MDKLQPRDGTLSAEHVEQAATRLVREALPDEYYKQLHTHYIDVARSHRPGIETVKLWFKDACGVGLTEEAATAVAVSLLAVSIFDIQFGVVLEIDSLNSLRQRIRSALVELQNDLSALIDFHEELAGDVSGRPCTGLPGLVELRDTVKAAAPGFGRFLPKGRGRKPEPWHSIAQDLGPVLKEAIVSGGKRAGFGQPTSRGVKVMSLALAWLGFEAVTPGAIVDAMRARKKPGK
jgi:hypothetical protein